MTDTKKNKHRADMELVESFAFTQSLDNWIADCRKEQEVYWKSLDLRPPSLYWTCDLDPCPETCDAYDPRFSPYYATREPQYHPDSGASYSNASTGISTKPSTNTSQWTRLQWASPPRFLRGVDFPLHVLEAVLLDREASSASSMTGFHPVAQTSRASDPSHSSCGWTSFVILAGLLLVSGYILFVLLCGLVMVWWSGHIQSRLC